MPTGSKIFYDGGFRANNPVLVALEEAALIWPNEPIDLVVSLGCGLPTKKKVTGVLAIHKMYMDSLFSSEPPHRYIVLH